MAPVKVFGAAMSTCTRRVLMTLEEAGVEYELINVELSKGEHKQPEFLKRQPFGVIPAMEDGDLQLFESRAISRYIASNYTDKASLLGKTPKERAIIENWIEVEANYFNGPCSTIVSEKFFKPAFYHGTTDEAVVATKVEALNKVLDVYEARLSKQDYLGGDAFSLADISHMPYLHYMISPAGVTEPLDKHPAVKAWWERVSSRPTWKKITAQ